MSDQEQNEKESQWRRRELGALWVRDGKNQKYLSGHVSYETMPGVTEKVKVVVFTNKNKEKNERAPDYVVYRSEDPVSQSVETTAEEVVDEVAENAEVPEELL
jgi:ribosomal protein L39E